MVGEIFNIILLGPAGAGKGTQAEYLIDKYDIQKIEAGELVRAKAKEDSDLGRKIYQMHKTGAHLPDEMIAALMEEAFTSIDSEKGVLVDGYPRTIGQAHNLDKIMADSKRPGRTLALWIKVGDEEAMRRLLNRSVCTQCKAVLTGRDHKVCPKCGGKIEVRDYDTDQEAIKKRLVWFHEKVMPAIEYYKEKGIIVEVNGEQSADEVFQEIVGKLEAKKLKS